ncbi:MAG: adenosylcobalamin-dependent ribonucleoside-diphosphate reductase, partial [Proteobacteria bacterium]|nr:adenosylcobalamin-dependent ribonucleoside-diphosphate reductase [Pseudomonadota bacterium]
VMGEIDDDLTSIFDSVKEAALTMQRGGGIGHDFSTLRPSGTLVKSVGAGASGPVSFMDVWDAMCRTIMSAGQRRGAMMGTLRCDHPDIEQFIDAKAERGRLTNFNMSVLVTDAFMAAVAADQPWQLTFAGQAFKTVRARALWDRIMRATYDHAEPGVIFIDRLNQRNNLAYCESIKCVNPCGEQPLPPYGACLLGSLNLTRFVTRPFEADACLDEARLDEVTGLAVRFLDNVIDVSGYPLARQRQEAKSKRRIGLGLTGLADALAMLGVRYGSAEAQQLAMRWMARIERQAYLASAALAAEKGAFPLYEPEPFMASPNVARLDEDVKAAIAKSGIRNGCLTSIAPTGTISLLAGNVSSGIEPIFDLAYRRRFRGAGADMHEETVEDYAYRMWRSKAGHSAERPAFFVIANELLPSEHLAMQAAVQAHVDSSISKTINCAEDIDFETFKDVYARAYELGLKGCTTFRPNAVTGAVLTPEASGAVSVAASSEEPEEVAQSTPASQLPVPSVARSAERQGVVYMAKPLEREP